MILTICSNNYGSKQHSEKIIPVTIRKALKGEIIRTYAAGLSLSKQL